MPHNIFVLHDNDGLVPLLEQEYESEAIFQTMLTNYPELLLFSDERTPYSNLLLIKQEHGIPIEANGGAYYFLDHLFVDQDGILTLIEVKRRGDTRSRREVIAQLLDYVTNGLAYWTTEDLQKTFNETHREKGRDPEEVIRDFLGNDTNPEQFWLQVESNIRNERIRMVYVADEVSPEMRRIVEFLSRQMKSATICAIELRQFVGKGVKAFIPDVIGNDSNSIASKASGGITRQWDEVTFFDELSNQNADVVPVARAIFEWGREKCSTFWWGKGKQTGSFAPIFEHDGLQCYPTFIWTSGTGDIQFQYLVNHPPFDKEEKRSELLDRLNEIPGFSIPQNSLRKRPPFPLKALINPKSLQLFIDTMNWVIDEVKRG